ncbi:hypothetical protein WICPIJ_001477 [Wickerhamomyces pijperi]|uniref:Uncharacterized protein n=1 Tax=Wickerhamomyces pijperi TaxID=599730 RepID=A0A9P8TPU9_WICPI|nr:hypothetical protein WICPIJ_001477 [Wickerhamomyces pijperi]
MIAMGESYCGSQTGILQGMRMWKRWSLCVVAGREIDVELHNGEVSSTAIHMVFDRTFLHLFNRWLSGTLERERDTGGVTVNDWDSGTLSRHLQVLRGDHVEAVVGSVDTTKDLLGFPLNLIFFTTDEWNNVVQDIHGWDTWGEASTGDSLQGVGDTNDEPWLFLAGGDSVVDSLLDNGQVVGVDSWDNQRNVGFSSVVLGVGDNG